MSEEGRQDQQSGARKDPPFHSLTFMRFKQPQGRSVFRMKEAGEGLYELHVEQGSAVNGTKFTRHVPQKTAQALKDALSQAGVFGWKESYPQEGEARWSLSVVFKQGVFALSSKGGDYEPEGFDAMLEQFYELDFPRPADQAPDRGTAPTQAPDLQNMDFSGLSDLFKQNGLDSYAIEEMRSALETLRRDPSKFQEMMRTEFTSMPPEQQESLLDLLASTGMATRDWWERFLRG